MGFAELIDRLAESMDDAEALREKALKDSRLVTRESKRAVQAIHRGEGPAAHLNEGKRVLDNMSSYLPEGLRTLKGGPVEDAMMELAEAFLLSSLLTGEAPPSPEELGISERGWILGLGDLPGELRRRALDKLRVGELDEADSMLSMMEEVHEALMRFDHPDAVLPLRRKQDVSRSVLERTRGDVAGAMARRF